MFVPFLRARAVAVEQATSLSTDPPIDDRLERAGVDVVKLVPALTSGLDQPGRLEDVEMLRDGLPQRTKPMIGHQPDADLEKSLSVPVGELVENRSARGVGQGLEDVAHRSTIGKSLLACQAVTRPFTMAPVGCADSGDDGKSLPGLTGRRQRFLVHGFG